MAQDTEHKQLRDMHAHLHRKCLELSARVSAMIDFPATGEDAAFAVAMVEESASAVAFWTKDIIERVQK